MRWHDFFRVIFGFCVLILCVGLVGCRFSEPGSVDELRLVEVNQILTVGGHQLPGAMGNPEVVLLE